MIGVIANNNGGIMDHWNNVVNPKTINHPQLHSKWTIKTPEFGEFIVGSGTFSVAHESRKSVQHTKVRARKMLEYIYPLVI
jgi:hypothetical protein